MPTFKKAGSIENTMFCDEPLFCGLCHKRFRTAETESVLISGESIKKMPIFFFANDVSRKTSITHTEHPDQIVCRFLQAYVFLTAKQVQAEPLEPVFTSLCLCSFVILNVCQQLHYSLSQSWTLLQRRTAGTMAGTLPSPYSGCLSDSFP